MPNWCANRLYFYGEETDIAGIRPLLSGELTSHFLRSEQEGLQLFVAGCAGILRPVEDFTYAPFPALTQAGKGSISPENIAFSRWLMSLQEQVELSKDNCHLLHRLWLNTGIVNKRWSSLSREQRGVIEKLYSDKYFDWGYTWRKGEVSEWWNRLCGNPSFFPGRPLDFLHVLPTRLDVEVNGFNGKLLEGIPSAYDWYLRRYGTKWPQGSEVNISFSCEKGIQVDFDTPWIPPDEALIAELSRQYHCCIEHWYAEQGGDFCGYACYAEGEQLQQLQDSLEWELAEEGDDVYSDIIGPEWLINNIAHFGG